MIFIYYIYKYTPAYRVTLPSYPIRETKHQIGMASLTKAPGVWTGGTQNVRPLCYTWLKSISPILAVTEMYKLEELDYFSPAQ